MRRLDGKVCVITGAAAGIGAATARRFTAEGATVVGWDLELDAMQSLDLARRVDVTDEEAVRAGYGEVTARFGRIDVLFNNAGISPEQDGSILDADDEVWHRVQRVNLDGVYHCCKHGIPHLLAAGGGSVINTASFVAIVGSAISQASYTASKGAVLALSRELGIEFAARRIRVNALCPGPVRTRMLDELHARDPALRERRFTYLPARRFAEVDEIANAVLFLASDESSYVNATAFIVDGGAAAAYLSVAGETAAAT
ncbi:MAG TPA: SDR family oxidoreductase [Solirubrobacteraceae bacterium]|nr:SDR family oxidoreductase [Solirubrobacteraceae bacterium]